jgi:hypothetical protein
MRGFHPTRILSGGLNLDELLRPADVYSHPGEVLADANLSINEKRAILASWASDACAVEAMPELRKAPSGSLVAFDDIMDALRTLDEQARKGMKQSPRYQRWLRQSDVI